MAERLNGIQAQRFAPAYLHQTNHKVKALWFELFKEKLRIRIPERKAAGVFQRKHACGFYQFSFAGVTGFSCDSSDWNKYLKQRGRIKERGMRMEYQSAIEELAQVLANRFSRISRGWEASTPGERQEDLENILAARNAAAKLQDLVTESEAAVLLALDDPLKAVADQWLELTGLDRPQDEALIRCVRILCGDTPRRDTQKASKKQKTHRRSPMTR